MFCKACTSSDKATDTVKIESPEALKKRQEEETRKAAEARRAEQERVAAEQRRAAQEREAQENHAEQQRLEEDRRRQAAEAAESRQRQQEKEERRRAEEAERRRKQEAAEAEAEKKRQDRKKLEEWLSSHKFHDPNAKKSKWFKTSLPLHDAVTDMNEDMVRILIDNNADVNAQNSSKQTPLQLAEKLSQKGPGKYDGVMGALRR